MKLSKNTSYTEMLKIERLKGSPDWDELDNSEKARIERLAELLDKYPDF